MSEAAFLAAIRENASDDTPRLVFADWLDEHGHPIRAAFVRDQIALAQLDEADPRYPELLARTRRYGVLTDERHRLECERGVTGAMFRRGFVAGVHQYSGSYARDVARFADLPLEQLRLTCPESDDKEVGKDVATRPELARLRTLVLGDGWRVDHLEPLLTACPHLAGLRNLAVGAPHTYGEERLRDVLSRMHLPAMDSFNLHFGVIPLLNSDDEEADECERDPDWSGFMPNRLLRRLHLVADEATSSDWTWPGPTWDWLIGSRHWATLEIADVRLNANPISGTDYIAAMPPGLLFNVIEGSQLTRLTINGSSLDDLLAAPDWRNLRALAVHDEFNAAQLARLFTHPQAQKLESLTLCGDHIRHERFEMGDLSDVIRTPGLLPKLRRLSLRSELAALANGSYREHLLRLDVGTRGTFGLRRPGLLDVPFPQLRRLTIDAVRSEDELERLFTTANLPNLCTLRIGYSMNLGEGAMLRLPRNPAMPHLSLLGFASPYDSWHVLDGGAPTEMALGTLPLDEDWWEPDPLATWFW